MREQEVIQAVKDKDVMLAAKEDAEPQTIIILLEYLSAMGMVHNFNSPIYCVHVFSAVVYHTIPPF